MSDYNIFQTSTAQKQSTVDVGLRNYMLGIYWRMSVGILWTAIVILGAMMMPALLVMLVKLQWLFFIGIIGLAFGAPYVIQRKSLQAGQLMFWLYATVVGLAIAPLIAMYVSAGLLHTVALAFFVSAAMFASTSIYGYLTKRDLSGVAGFISLAFWGILIAIIVNFFLKSSALGFGISIVMVLFYAVITAFQTQQLKSLYHSMGAEQKSRMAIMGALTLYVSFIGFFLSFLRIFGGMGGGFGGRQ